ncbi:MAG: MBL fold metallo-hydrolase [Acidobacteria bacterium]|jgi:glyoxylase-like metal-dependent hydrolase (beta-lactamase superfamily II)|nr:MBL fold metallo-hydrolase [Acidobacteriota bacterium]
MPYLSLEVGDLGTNCYLFFAAGSRHCFVIDPGAEAEKILARIAEARLLPQAVVLTHAHPDHLGAAAALVSRFGVPLWVHPADEKLMCSPAGRGLAAMFGVKAPAADRLLLDGDVLALDGLELKVIHSPGHSPGSILLYGDGLLFTGDTLFKNDVGRTDLPGGDEEELKRSLARIREFPAATVILPGHGEGSVLEIELKDNPYL